jgi:hypothetical protein
MALEPEVIERSKVVRAVVHRARRRRVTTIEDAQRTRRRARELRARTEIARNQALEQRWELWAARVVTEVPDRIPSSWEAFDRADHELLLAAARECERVAAAAHIVLAAEPDGGSSEVLVLAAALAEVAASRARTDLDDGLVALAGTARLLEQLNDTFGTPGGMPEHAVLAVASRSALGALRLALARFHEEVEP